MRGYTYVQYIKLCVLFGTRNDLVPILQCTLLVFCSTIDKCRRNGCETKGGAPFYRGVCSIQ